MSIEEEKERIFLKKIVKNLKTIKYFIGLQKDQGEWRWLSNGNSVHASTGEAPWSPREPNGGPGINCATIYGKYETRSDGLYDDLSCSSSPTDAGYICERAVPCTKEEKGMGISFKKGVSFRRRRTWEHALSVYLFKSIGSR